MKRFLKVALALSLFIPFFVNAAVKVVYDDAKWGANTYITGFKNYRWYIDLNTKKKYGYDGSDFSTVSGFDYGGLINQSEYNISINKNQSYLKSARSYWTLTSKDSKFYSVENGKFSLFDKDVSAAGVRPTEYIMYQTEVSGQGSYVDPWVFVKPNFYVDIEYFNTVIERDGKIVADGIAQYGDTITYSLKLKNNGLRDSVVNTREIAMVSQIDKIIKMLPETSSVKFGNKTLTLEEAKQAIQDLFSDSGYTFTIVPGQEVEIIFKVRIIGNAGDVVNSQVLYTMDGLEADPGPLNKISVEKTVYYNEIAENGSNVVMVLDTSGSMSYDTYDRDLTNLRLNPMREAASEFIDIFLTEQFNGTNEICVVFMPYDATRVADFRCSQDATTLKNFVNSKNEKGWTPYTAALKAALEQLNGLKTKHIINSNSVVFLTDGVPVIGNDRRGEVYDNNYQPYADQIMKIGTLYAIGFYTNTTADDLLKRMLGDESNYYKAGKDDLSEAFEDISRRINEKSKMTTKGVLAISRNIDRTKDLTIEVYDQSDKLIERKVLNYDDAINQSYIINKGNRYEINIKKFKSYEKIRVTYFLELK